MATSTPRKGCDNLFTAATNSRITRSLGKN